MKYIQNSLIIQTPNLVLHHFSIDDVHTVFLMSQEDGMRNWIPDQVYKDEQEAAEVLQYLMEQYTDIPTPNISPYVLGIELKETGELIGHIGLSPIDDGNVEIGYAIAENQQGNGYATEAVEKMTSWAINQLGIPIIYGLVAKDNKPSCTVLEKAGYVFVEEKYKNSFGRNLLRRIYKKSI